MSGYQFFIKWIYGDQAMRHVTDKLFSLCVPVIVLLVLTGCQTISGNGKQKNKVMLFNGQDLAGWKVYIPDEGVDQNDVWSVKDGVIYCSGVPNGYMRTVEEYGNYKLHLEWRWVAKPANSGVLIHATGPDQLWPKCIECQLMAGSAGDMVLMNGTGITIDGQDKQNPNERFVIIAKKQHSTEKPAGQWNSYDIVCRADTISAYVNGVLQNEGTNATRTSGWIALQSEGGPIEFRNIYLEMLD
jgi:hypothetical protein